MVVSSTAPHAVLLLFMDAEQRFNRTFFLETGVERAKVPPTPQHAAYHSIVLPYVCRGTPLPRSRWGAVSPLVSAPGATS